MGLVGGVLRFVWRRTLLLAGIALVLLLVPGLPPYTTFKPIPLAPTLPREGVLAPNNALNNAKRLHVNELVGPEAFQVHNNILYTTLGSGEVVKLSPGGHTTFVTKIGQPCEGSWQENKCGRPLGFRIDDAGKYIYIADPYYGIWKVDLKTDKKQLLVPPGVEIEGKAPKLFNSLALAKNGDLYWTDSSSDFELRDGSYTTLVDPSGRLLHYNAAKNQSRVLINGMWFANGVAVSPNEDFVLVNDGVASRILRIYINGPKKGQKDIFLDGIPGVLDNLQPLTDGSGVLVGLYTVFDEEHPLVVRSLAPFPLIRKLFARLLRVIEIPFEYLNQHFPNQYFEKIIYNIGHFSSIAFLLPKSSGIMQVDWNGKIVGAWFNQDGTTATISDAIVYQGQLYLGSPHNPFIAVVQAPEQLKKAFSVSKPSPSAKVEQKIKEEPKKVKPIEQPRTTEPPVVKKSAEPVKETPKPAQAKPVEAKPVTAKPATPKPVEIKPVTEKPAAAKPLTQKPVEVKPVTPKPSETKPVKPKPAEAKPVTPKKAEEKTVTPKPVEKAATVKPVQPKPTVEQPKPATASKTEPKIQTIKQDKTKDEKKKPEQIPIVEEIKVDTVRPTKEPLKVIKRNGPAEIPNPAL